MTVSVAGFAATKWWAAAARAAGRRAVAAKVAAVLAPSVCPWVLLRGLWGGAAGAGFCCVVYTWLLYLVLGCVLLVWLLGVEHDRGRQLAFVYMPCVASHGGGTVIYSR